ncbi:hypothetical protein RSAG8_04280, partial [Rhizoctonia solani AG-8 WAC10335]
MDIRVENHDVKPWGDADRTVMPSVITLISGNSYGIFLECCKRCRSNRDAIGYNPDLGK